MTSQTTLPVDDWLSEATDRRRGRPLVQVDELGVRFQVSGVQGHPWRRSLARRTKVWALRHVAMRVYEGDSVAIIGANGAGKSTLLRVLAGVLGPDEGSVRIRGKVTALLDLGVGFDPRLTGRENVELMGALMGLRPAIVRERLDGVRVFAGLEDFFDLPLRTYSSGMRARLGFAAATMVEPHILVLDEVLGTGDAAFRRKSRAKLEQMTADSRSVVLATHSRDWMEDWANYAYLLHRGRIMAEGAPRGVAAYYESMASGKADALPCADGDHLEALCARCGVRLHNNIVE